MPVPIEAMIAAELVATGSVSTGRFQGLPAGKTGQEGAPGSGRLRAAAAGSKSAARAKAARRALLMLGYPIGRVGRRRETTSGGALASRGRVSCAPSHGSRGADRTDRERPRRDRGRLV